MIDWFKEFGVSTKIRFDEYKVSSNSMECCIKLTRIRSDEEAFLQLCVQCSGL